VRALELLHHDEEDEESWQKELFASFAMYGSADLD
jgi:hypothetical protein